MSLFPQLDFWTEPAHPTLPVDVRVPSQSLQMVENYLDSNNIHYSVMIKNLQVGQHRYLVITLSIILEICLKRKRNVVYLPNAFSTEETRVVAVMQSVPENDLRLTFQNISIYPVFSLFFFQD